MTAHLTPEAALQASPDQLDDDSRFMAAALTLARRGLGRVAPNPTVGALIVKDGALVARGWTGDGGRPHGEALALANAGKAARGATLYVTLEPCSHHGRTPPCVDAIIAAGIGRVVSTIDDPDPRVAGQGHAKLRAAGIALRTGVLAEEAARINRGHILRVTQNRPMLTLKLAETADGFAAGPAGAPRLAITGDLANATVHMQRALHDAILIGSGTAMADDPLLTVRLPGMKTVKPLRIVLDSRLSLKPSVRLIATAAETPTLIVTTETAKGKAAPYLGKHAELAYVATDGAGYVDLGAALSLLAERGLTRLFCEGGPHLAAALMQKGYAEEVMLLTSDKPLGAAGLPVLDKASHAELADPQLYRLVEDRRIGSDRMRHYERRA